MKFFLCKFLDFLFFLLDIRLSNLDECVFKAVKFDVNLGFLDSLLDLLDQSRKLMNISAWDCNDKFFGV